MLTETQRSTYQHIVDSFDSAAFIQYGETAVTELEHALQCAELADNAGADDELVFACMLHDVARFAVPQDQVSDTLQNLEPSKDAKGHGEKAAELMRGLLPERSLFCIQHHAEAKQYLCQTNEKYRQKLSAASIKTLAIQSDSTSQERLNTLAKHEWWEDAIRLRVWDDAGKVKGKETRPLTFWLERLEQFLAMVHGARSASS